MCQIFAFESKIEQFPEEEIIQSTINNPHGMGLIYWKDKKMKVEKIFEDTLHPDKVMKTLENTRKISTGPLFMHLRWKTKGANNIDNCHPFEVYYSSRRQVMFMHNGTLADFSPLGTDSRSDTRIFSETLLKPLLSKWKSIDSIFSAKGDPVFNMLMDEYFYNFNRGILIPNKGEAIILNKNAWHTPENNGKHSGWISANDYSFDPAHRKPTPKIYPVTTYYGTSKEQPAPWWDAWADDEFTLLPTEKEAKEVPSEETEKYQIENWDPNDLISWLSSYNVQELEDLAALSQDDWKMLIESNKESMPWVLDQMSMIINSLLYREEVEK